MFWRRIWNMIAKDVRLGMRDNLLIYMAFSPVLLALLATVALRFVEAPRVIVAVEQGAKSEVVAYLEEFVTVEEFADRDAVVRRVEQEDHVLGVTGRGGVVEVIAAGDEPGQQIELIEALVELAHAPDELDEVDAGALWELPLRALLHAALLFLVITSSGLCIGFTMLYDKESRALAAYATAPVSFASYLGAKALLAGGLGGALAVLVTLIMQGAGASWGGVLVAVLASVPTGFLLGALLGGLAEDQLGAVAILKSLLFVFGSLPLAGFIVSDPWTYLFWPLCNYWSVAALWHGVRGDPGVWSAAGLALLTSAPIVVGVLIWLRERLGMA